MLKNKRLKEAIENVGMVNNLDSQDFDKKSVGTAPISYADAVIRARKRKEACKKAYEDQVKVARAALKKEVSNEEHPEPIGKIKGNKERKMTLDEGLFESLDEESQDYKDAVATNLVRRYYQDGRMSLEQLHRELLRVFDGNTKRAFEFLLNFGKKPVKEALMSLESFEDEHVGKAELKEWMPSHAVWVKKEGKWKPYSALDFDTLSDEEIAAFKGLGYDDVKLLPNDGSEPDEIVESVVCPKCGKEPCECKVEESLYPKYVSYQGKKMRVQGVRPDGKYALSEPKYSGLDITNHPEYLVDVSKEDVEPLSVITYPNGREVTDIDLDKALDYFYGTDRDMDNSKYTDDEKQRAVNYWVEKTDGLYPYEVYKKKVEQLEESKEDAKIFRVTYKHSPTVFSSVMVKAANEDEAKQKLAVKKPGKDIVGVSVMSDYEVKDMTNRGMSLMEAKVIDDFSSYEPWGAAVSTFDNIQNAGKMDALEQLIDDMYPDGVDRAELNDLLAFESDWVYSMLNMSSEEGVDEEGDGPAIDFEEEE